MTAIEELKSKLFDMLSHNKHYLDDSKSSTVYPVMLFAEKSIDKDLGFLTSVLNSGKDWPKIYCRGKTDIIDFIYDVIEQTLRQYAYEWHDKWKAGEL